MTPEQKEKEKYEKNFDRHDYEIRNSGDYELAYPLTDSYQNILGRYSESQAPENRIESDFRDHRAIPDISYNLDDPVQRQANYEYLEDIAEHVYESFTTGSTHRNRVLTLAEYKKMLSR